MEDDPDPGPALELLQQLARPVGGALSRGTASTRATIASSVARSLYTGMTTLISGMRSNP
jgi:nitrate/nitrite transporter NarK